MLKTLIKDQYYYYTANLDKVIKKKDIKLFVFTILTFLIIF
jgi:hypothetical protein